MAWRTTSCTFACKTQRLYSRTAYCRRSFEERQPLRNAVGPTKSVCYFAVRVICLALELSILYLGIHPVGRELTAMRYPRTYAVAAICIRSGTVCPGGMNYTGDGIGYGIAHCFTIR